MPGDLLHGTAPAAGETRGIIPHHCLPLVLGHLVLAKIKTLADPHPRRRLLIVFRIPADGAHQELPRGNSHELDPVEDHRLPDPDPNRAGRCPGSSFYSCCKATDFSMAAGAPVVENLCQSRRGQEGKGAAKGDRQVGEWFHGMVPLGEPSTGGRLTGRSGTPGPSRQRPLKAPSIWLPRRIYAGRRHAGPGSIPRGRPWAQRAWNSWGERSLKDRRTCHLRGSHGRSLGIQPGTLAL